MPFLDLSLLFFAEKRKYVTSDIIKFWLFLIEIKSKFSKVVN